MKELYTGHTADAARARERYTPRPLTWLQTATAVFAGTLAALALAYVLSIALGFAMLGALLR